MKKCPCCYYNVINHYDYDEGTIYICKKCELQWAEYNELYKKKADSIDIQEEIRKKIHSRYMSTDSILSLGEYQPYVTFFDFISRVKHSDKLHILDIGCGNGNFIKECLRRGHEAFGIEINDNLSHNMSTEIRERIIFKPVESLNGFSDTFDVITFWDSFEHFSSAFEVLNNLKKHLTHDGIVYLRVNNNRDIVNIMTRFVLKITKTFGKRMLKTCFGFPDHVWNFSKAGMYKRLENDWVIIHSRFSETPACRFTNNRLFVLAIQAGYLINRLIYGGKIGEYYITPK